MATNSIVKANGAVEELAIERIGHGAVERLNIGLVADRRQAIVKLMQECMQDGVDFGVIPGCAKPTLLQPGAQKLVNLFQLDPEFEHLPDSVLEKEFILHSYKCTLYAIASGQRIASGCGSCNSREDKYGMRTTKRSCPACGKATIIKGKIEFERDPKFKGGWVCWFKQGKSDGCGAKFVAGDPAIEAQPEGKTPNENIWEQENTIRKMAMKRAQISAVLNATGASDIFTQDIEDMAEFQNRGEPEEAKPHHREGNEHFSSYCQDCQRCGVPKELIAILHHGNIYVKDPKTKESLHDVYPAKPAAAAIAEELASSIKETLKEGPGRTPLVPVDPDSPHPFKEWLQRAADAKKAIGEQDYYRILKVHGFTHANQAKFLADQRKLRAEWGDCYRFQQTLAKANTGNPAPLIPVPLPPLCPECGGGMKMVPAGVSKKTHKPYDAFYGCNTRGCKCTAKVPPTPIYESLTPLADEMLPEEEPPTDLFQYDQEHRDDS